MTWQFLATLQKPASRRKYTCGLTLALASRWEAEKK
jgi:hypothetical protein